MSTSLIQAWATGISTVLAAAGATTVAIVHAIAIYKGKIQSTPNGNNNNGGI